MPLLMNLKRLHFITPDNKRSLSVEVINQSQHGHVSFCTSTKRHFYYMPMRVTHENNLRVRLLS